MLIRFHDLPSCLWSDKEETTTEKGLIKDSIQVHPDTLSDRSVWVTQHHGNHLILQLRGLQSKSDQHQCTAACCYTIYSIYSL